MRGAQEEESVRGDIDGVDVLDGFAGAAGGVGEGLFGGFGFA